MGLRLPEGMETLGGQKNGGADEEGAPESWEMADLEESMKNLMASSKCSSGSNGDEIDALENIEGDVSASSESASGAAKTVDQVDGFLREALQNPRDRLTILRLEQEVERFMRNPKQQQLEFQPMPSSYLRLAAHRVAQHYFLQSLVVDSGSTEGSRIVARKNAESRYPTIRLADIPVESPEEEKPLLVTMPKVAIKRRPSKGGRASGEDGANGFGNRLNPSKSVEERKEEYNKARARIFSNELAGKCGDVDGLDDVRLAECFSSVDEVLKVEEKYKAEESHDRDSPVRMINDYSISDSRSSVNLDKESFNRNKLMNGSNSRVAIFRDREKDRKDPDYDRSYDRYSQRFDPGFGMTLGPFGMQAIYTPVVNYNTEFPQLAGPRPQLHMEPPPPPPIPQQRMRPPWGTPVPGNMSFRPPDPLLGPFTQGHIGPHSGMSMYMHAPQYAYPGHSLAFMHPHDRFQQSLTQPHPQQQPDTSFNHARRR
ncbi:hypothetical protein MPTK1_1g01650 [Marchantia polymorpha subsp. ruderalis]|uniref:R3H domain-containing protein n=2 Tax=Marchantia polymorpha TaxID=3197 RepID=A0AAF6AKG0_MARPO|nr:hypothetical protein MARPO_0029s0081 [Marchantia polymorpha]BBM96930.1 hypothetical protein Mp_1g01650 [Marchantia polymorpha subsp. ruderalis]|eukprot:PTQ42552.1 hypothetical protein MARPO_0029s0081 [Marchantia polymorpha]